MAYMSSSPPRPAAASSNTRLLWNNVFDAIPATLASSSPYLPPKHLDLDAAPVSDSDPRLDDGELSPTFDQAFQDSMNISASSASSSSSPPKHQRCSSERRHRLQHGPSNGPDGQSQLPPPLPPKSSPHDMDCSPACKPVSTSTFDAGFFSRLSGHQPSSTKLGLKRPSLTSAEKQAAALQTRDANSPARLAPPNFAALKRPTGLMRTSSAVESEKNPFQISPRPPLLERARSDNVLTLENVASRNVAVQTRKPSGLSKETVLGPRPAPVPYSMGGSQGRKISGSSRVRAALPSEWTQGAQRPRSSTMVPPQLVHANSAPNVRPVVRPLSEEVKSFSESTVPTRRTLGSEAGSSLAREILLTSSPSGMDLDPLSPAPGSLSPQLPNQLLSPGFGDLFADTGVDASSPANELTGNRKRAIEDADSSFNSLVESSPVKTQSNPSTWSRASGRPVLHKATSTASLSRKRGSGHSATTSGSSTFFAAALAAQAEVASKDGPSGNVRHRKMSRGVDGMAQPTMLKNTRRSHSMCDTEFFASPPLDAGSGNASGYFSKSKEPKRQTVNGLLAPPKDMVSPARPAPNPALFTYQPSPEASFTSGFGHKEAKGKILPCFPVKEDGLMRITASTLNDLMLGKFDDHIERFVVVDCRFDYEFKGGHIEGAVNLGTAEAIDNFFFTYGEEHDLYAAADDVPAPSKSGEPDALGNPKKTVLVFHCEFSQKRAPSLAKHLRSKDRALNHAAYPAVHYPELYVLEGGYAECWKAFPEQCDPKGYVQMDDPRHLAARASDLGELRRKRMGVRAKSYTFGESMKALAPQNKHFSAAAFKPAPSAAGNASTSRPASGSGLFAGVSNLAQLCVHPEEHEDSADERANTSGEASTSFNGTKHAAMSGLDSSPCATGGGDSPCFGQTKKPLMLHHNPSLKKPLAPARLFQRANTAQASMFRRHV